MTDQPITENPLADTTIEDLMAEAKGASYHPILKVWREVLVPARTERHNRITPQWASRLVNTYPGITFPDVLGFKDLYFDRIETMLGVLEDLIDTDSECLTPSTPEEDVEHNADHYLQMITNWQIVILRWELEWDCQDPRAPIELATIAEIHKMFFGEQGLTSLLDNIPFEFSDMHRDALALSLQEFREGMEASQKEGDGE